MKMPRIIYGTAWKKERTSKLVIEAVKAGFRGIDTAAQPKHYNEAGVGTALQELHRQGILREDLFIQTKFSPISAHDPKSIPYDPQAPLEEQVQQSFSSSQKNLGTDYVNSLLLHAPVPKIRDLMEIWTAMESIYQQGGAKMIGVSNFELDFLKELYERAKIKPRVIQNCFDADTHYDIEIRKWCANRDITYQSFWTLTGNPQILSNETLRTIAQRHRKTGPQIFFRYLTQLGIVPLTGTTSKTHMLEDLEIFNFNLTESEKASLDQLLEKA